MTTIHLVLLLVGIATGMLGGILGIGGGMVMVPVMVGLGLSGLDAVGTSTLAVLVIALVGSVQNWRMGFLSLPNLLMLGAPAVLTSFLGTQLANAFTEYILLSSFGVFLLLNIYLVNLNKRVVAQAKQRAATGEEEATASKPLLNPLVARGVIGGLAGLLAGIFGVGGGVVMVPLQILLLQEEIKVAIQTSLGAIVVTGLSAFGWHLLSGNVQASTGILLGLGGAIGVQVGTRVLPRLPDSLVTVLFNLLLALLSVYFFYKAGLSWQGGLMVYGG